MARQHYFLSIAADHPACAGHFPGNPIVPGAMLLDLIITALTRPGERCLEVAAAKFTTPVRPGATLALTWEGSPTGLVRFDGTVDGVAALSGSLRFGK